MARFNFRNHIAACLLLVLGMVPGWGQQTIIPADKPIPDGFAIFADQATYAHCKEAIDAYRAQLEQENMSVVTLVADWESPEHVKFFIDKYYAEQNLEGAVFIGDIPVPMVRRAQFLTSAFKMDESRDMRESSVPSDRFYDDFGLQFDFIRKDSTENFYYYDLSSRGDQRISCNIYTARIKPTAKGEAGYRQIREYLAKAVAAHREENVLDHVVSYTGEGSFSNSIVAWKDERITLQEQMPAAFRTYGGAKFYIFHNYPYMKETMTRELRREEVDYCVFHCHGMPERQYMTGSPVVEDEDLHYGLARYSIREQIRTARDWGKDIEELQQKLAREYHLDRTWFDSVFVAEKMAADSTFEVQRGITVDDVLEIRPNARLMVFDACYNGDFREQRNIAAEYIFAGGKTLVGFGNSVNVLQDKSSSDLLGILSCGARVGEWARNVNILESHLHGDPTYRFAPHAEMPRIKYHSQDPRYWLAVLRHPLPSDVKGLALHRLFELDYPGLSELLLQVFQTAPEYMLRLQAMHLCAYYDNGDYARLLRLAVNDPYEFIRRKAAFYMGQTGRNDFIPDMADLYMYDRLSARIAFNVTNSAGMFNTGAFTKAVDDRIEKADYLYDKKDFGDRFHAAIASPASMRDYVIGSLIDRSRSDKARLAYATGIKNRPYPQCIDDLLRIAADDTESEGLRRSVIEVLGWYTLSPRRSEIARTCRKMLEDDRLKQPALREELLKTAKRLETYMR